MDMSQVIVPKSDQLNSDDLISGPRTVKITGVSIKGGAEQPIAISFENDDGKPYKPCKSMCRVMVTAWGADSKKYTGRSMTLYREPTVKWAGMEVGGIRISHMSDIAEAMTMALTATRGSRKPFTVKPIESHEHDSAIQLQGLLAYGDHAAKKGSLDYEAWWKSLRKDERTAIGAEEHERMKNIAAAVQIV